MFTPCGEDPQGRCNLLRRATPLARYAYLSDMCATRPAVFDRGVKRCNLEVECVDHACLFQFARISMDEARKGHRVVDEVVDLSPTYSFCRVREVYGDPGKDLR
jgi:hypothetical protein